MNKYIFTSLLSLLVIVAFTSFMSPQEVSAQDVVSGVTFGDGGKSIMITMIEKPFFDAFYIEYYSGEDGSGDWLEEESVYNLEVDDLPDYCENLSGEEDLLRIHCVKDIPSEARSLRVGVVEVGPPPFYQGKILFSDLFNIINSNINISSLNTFGTRFCSDTVTTFCRPKSGFTNNNSLISIYTELLGLYQQLLSAMQGQNSL